MLNQQTKKNFTQWESSQKLICYCYSFVFYLFIFLSKLIFYISIPFLLFPWTQFYSRWKLSTKNIFFLKLFFSSWVAFCFTSKSTMIFLRKKFPNNIFFTKKTYEWDLRNTKNSNSKNTHRVFRERRFFFLTGLVVGKIETEVLFLETPISTGWSMK